MDKQCAFEDECKLVCNCDKSGVGCFIYDLFIERNKAEHLNNTLIRCIDNVKLVANANARLGSGAGPQSMNIMLTNNARACVGKEILNVIKDCLNE